MRTTIKQSKLPGFVIETVYNDKGIHLTSRLLPDYLCMPVGTDVNWSYPEMATPDTENLWMVEREQQRWANYRVTGGKALIVPDQQPPSLWQKLKALLKNA